MTSIPTTFLSLSEFDSIPGNMPVNSTAFYKKFYEYAGCTPQEYRDRHE